ncbi:Crp/Fnr family transcriptional regulator [Kitasatospora sp. NPDC056138]|uniref:Crp/Fnr family transcriptional regulator n=1 Tax=Kitasatospora sp. NPDC056138 TaxID=3345724 RepID=UPI0035D6BE99
MSDHTGGTLAPFGQTLRHLTGDVLWDGMLAAAYERRHPIGSTLLRQGEPGTHVLALRAGVAKVIRQERSGDLTLLAFRGPGELLGEVAVLDGGVRSASVQAISDCSVAVLSGAAFLRFVTDHHLFPVMVRYALGRLRESDLARGGRDVVARLSAALVNLAEVSAESPSPRHEHIELALTREELAQYLGVSRNTVTAGLAELGALRVQSGRKRIVIGDLSALRHAASMLRD